MMGAVDDAGAREGGSASVPPDDRHAGCALCAVARDEAAAAPVGPGTTEYADERVVVLVGRDPLDVLVAPRRHVAGLASMPDGSGAVLAALRRTVAAVTDVTGAAEASVDEVLDLPGTAGHVCFRISPRPGTAAGAGSGGGATSWDGEDRDRLVAAIVGSLSAGGAPDAGPAARRRSSGTGGRHRA